MDGRLKGFLPVSTADFVEKSSSRSDAFVFQKFHTGEFWVLSDRDPWERARFDWDTNTNPTADAFLSLHAEHQVHPFQQHVGLLPGLAGLRGGRGAAADRKSVV